MDPSRMQQPLAVPSMQPQAMAIPTSSSAVAPPGDTKGSEGAEQQQQQHQQHHDQTATTNVVLPVPKTVVPYGHGGNKHGQHPQQPLMYHQLDGLPMSGDQQLPPQLHYNPGQGYSMTYWPGPPPGTDMALQGPPGHDGSMPWCLMHHGGPQQQHLLSDAASLKRRQRLDKNKESVRNYRKKKREEETNYKLYVGQLEHQVKQYLTQIDRLDADKVHLQRHIELMTQENVALKDRLELLSHLEKNLPSSQ